MINNRLTAQIQHAIQYPSGHLDRFAPFGPAFEMDGAGAGPVPAKPAESLAIMADQPAADTAPDAATPLSNPRQFLLGGKAIFTLQGLQARYTFQITRSDPDQSGQTVLFVSMLTGPDNTSDYTYVGLLAELSGEIRLTRKSRYTDQSVPVVALRWACRRIWAGKDITPATIYHLGRCGRCGRALTVPSSVESGFGPECLGKLGGD